MSKHSGKGNRQMTRCSDGSSVSLNQRDWLGIVGIAITLATLMMTSFLSHDRHITSVATRQIKIQEDIEATTNRIERLEEMLLQLRLGVNE